MHGQDDDKSIQNFSQKTEQRRPFGKLGIHGRITLKWVCGLDSPDSGRGQWQLLQRW
jgi:hypothetical protein